MVAPARCACGYTKFAVRVDRTPAILSSRWRPVPPTGGLGSTPLGMSMGGASQGWGRFVVSVTTGVANTFCLSCQRVRRGTPVGGGVAMASFFEDTAINVVMTDVVEPSCMTARFTLPGRETHVVPIELLEEVPPLLGSPLEVQEFLPSGAVVAERIYRVPIPTVFASGLYRLLFVDDCLDTTQLIGIVAIAGELDVYGRAGDVVAIFGDYSASLVESGVEGVTLDESLDLLQAAVESRVLVGGDLGGTPGAPRVIKLQGRDVKNEAPGDGARLVWSDANDRWEPKLP